MEERRNPFTPTFGMVPPFLAGRDRLLREMTRAFEDGPGNPNLSTILVGARGTGKTTLLSRIGDVARSHGCFRRSRRSNGREQRLRVHI